MARIPRPRFTVRRLMVAVAIVSLALGIAVWMKRRSERFWAEHEFQKSFPVIHSHCYDFDDYEPYELDPWREFTEYHINMRNKYERAARYPWLPVEPDPPEPPKPY